MKYDVLIYELETKRVDAVAGSNMNPDYGHHNASKRLDTVLSRINDRYSAGIFPTGKYEKGDVVDVAEEWTHEDIMDDDGGLQ